MSFRYRPSRTKTDVIAILNAEGDRSPVQILNISRDGAKISVPYLLMRGTAVDLAIDGARMPALIAWSQDGHAGLKFLDRLDRDTLVHLESAGFAVTNA